jgi:hypothetical protein
MMAEPRVLVTLQGQAEEGRAPSTVIYLSQDNTLPILQFRLVNGDGLLYDLNDAMVRFRMRERNAAAGTYKVNAACIYLPGHLFEYPWADGDTDTPGEYFANLLISLAGGLQHRTETFLVRIRARL